MKKSWWFCLGLFFLLGNHQATAKTNLCCKQVSCLNCNKGCLQKCRRWSRCVRNAKKKHRTCTSKAKRQKFKKCLRKKNKACARLKGRAKVQKCKRGARISCLALRKVRLKKCKKQKTNRLARCCKRFPKLCSLSKTKRRSFCRSVCCKKGKRVCCRKRFCRCVKKPCKPVCRCVGPYRCSPKCK